ncbi:MAG: GntR family transcriptional regulator [Caldilineales bacterium]
MLVERSRSVTSQAISILTERIRTQTYAPGSRLPSESDLALELGVSRASIRTALSRLATQGLVLRKQGDGTYVNIHLENIPGSLGGLWNFLRLIEFSGHEPSIQVLSQEVRPASAAEAQALAMPEPAEVLFLRRLFLADTTPVILAGNAIPLALLRVAPQECDGTQPLDAFFRRYCSLQIAYDIFDISATLPDAEVCTILQLPPQQPLLALKQIFYSSANEPLLCGSSEYNEKRLSLRLAQSWS